MFNINDYTTRGYNFLHNRLAPNAKRLSSLMLYATDLCDSGCKHCLIWTKRPTTVLSLDTIKKIMQSKCVHSSTNIGLEGGEFLLHPEAEVILSWFRTHHPNFDLFSNCLRPDHLIAMVKKHPPKRLYISLDGPRETYRDMRGKDGYDSVLKVIQALKGSVPIFVMFTLSPYNDFDDLEHVAELCEKEQVFLRVGIYNNIPFFDTIEKADTSYFGQHKNEGRLTFTEAKERIEQSRLPVLTKDDQKKQQAFAEKIPSIIKRFGENYDYVRLYENWGQNKLRLTCNSILDSLIVLPNGDVPICQNLPTKLGNIYSNSLDEVFNSDQSNQVQQQHVHNCNQCWISYHRKYDIILYRNFERFFGRTATTKLMGYYKWDEDESVKYSDLFGKDH